MIEIITSPANKKVKLAASLKQKKHRDETNLFIAEGIRLTEEAVKSNWQIEFCICTDEVLHNSRVTAIFQMLEQKNCDVYQVSKAIYDKISDTKEPQGILLVLQKQKNQLATLDVADNPLFIVLDELQDPGNVGTIIRTADAVGCHGVIIMKESVDLFAAKTVRATMGSLFHVPIITEVSVDTLLTFTEQHKIVLQVTALDQEAKEYFDSDFRDATAIVFGNEGKGVNRVLLDAAKQKIFIPMLGQSESLNVATAAAVILYECFRQRRSS